MNPKKRIILISLILIILAVAIIINYGGHNVFSKDLSLSEQIEQGKLSELSLTIYYISPYILTLHPLSADDLINVNYVHKVVVNGSELEEHIDLLKQIGNADLIPVEHRPPRVNARLYYVFETKAHRKVCDVCAWGEGNSIFVNGIEVQSNDTFYEIVKPFLPEDAIKKIENYLIKGLVP